MAPKPLALETELFRFRDKLLDSSLRNPLLNYRISKRKTVEIAPVSTDHAYKRLVDANTWLRLLPETTKTASNPVKQPPGKESIEQSPIVDNTLTTVCSWEKFEALLRGMLRDAKTSIEETGINYLHLAVGFLHWSETNNDESELRRAPLILIPIQLEQTISPRGGLDYKILWNEDEIQSNASLRKKLESDFAIKLPDFDESMHPSDYFQEVTKSIAARPAWRVDESMLLGFFSFHKLSMFVDLDPKLWSESNAINESSLASRLISGNDSTGGSGLYAPDYQIDEHPIAQNIELPLDADSSQISALADIAAGKSLVIEGPPGTGKSQTIANAISHAMEQGKTVLFVAEKLAALEVVHKRLAQAGLADFCLELHGHAVSPKKIYESLGERLARQSDSQPQSSRDRSHQESYRAKLHAYLKASSKKIGPYEEPLYDLFWRVVRLRQCDVPVLREIEVDCNLDQPQFDEAVQSLQAFSKASSQYDLPKQSAWWGFFPKDLTPAESDRIVDLLPRLEKVANDLEECLIDISTLLCVDKEAVAAFLGDGSEKDLQQTISSPPAKPNLGFESFINKEIQAQAIRIQQLVNDSKHAEAILKQHLDPSSHTFEQALVHFASLNEEYWQSLPRDTELWRLSELSGWVSQIESLFAKIYETIGKLRVFGFPDSQHLEDLERHLNFVHLTQHSVVQGVEHLQMEWFSDSTRKLLSEAKSKTEELLKRKSEINEYFHTPSAPDSERLLFLIKQFRTLGKSWFRWFSGDYRMVVKELRQFATFPKGFGYAKTLAMLESFYSFDKDLKALENNTTLQKVLTQRFQGLDTDWKSIGLLCDWVATAKKMGVDHRRANELLASRDELIQQFSVKEIKQTILSIDTEFKSQWAKQLQFGEKWHRTARLAERVKSLRDLKQSLLDLDKSAAYLKLGTSSKFDVIIQCVIAAKQLEKIGKEIHRIKQTPDTTDYMLLEEAQDGDVDYQRLIDWLSSLRKAGVPPTVYAAMDRLGSEAVCRRLSKAVQRFEQAEQDWTSTRHLITNSAVVDSAWMSFRDSQRSPSATLLTDVRKLTSESKRLPAWLSFCRTLDRCKRAGVDAFAMAAATDQVDESQLSDAYQLALFNRLAELELNSNEIGFRFTTNEMEDIRKNFQELDRLRIQGKQSEIAQKVLMRQAPEGNSRGRVGEYTEMGLIRHEIGKKSRHCKTRDLMTRAGRAVQVLKPCFLMSPLSLARYLPAATMEFDMVIMDEASQIKPEDAIGAILRAKQLVVVGDPKQLPPTSFFDQTDDEIEDEDATQFDNAESVLEVAQRSFQPYRRLRWHYRSQHENLIQFSNVKFYDEDLVVFPSPSDTLGGLGVVHHQVPDATCVKGENLREAQRIVERIVEHAKQRTGESLGVAAFNQKQSELIDGLVAKACSSDPEFANLYAQMREGDDGFFVKNLENIQGDERDVIFISYTYGRDPSTGKVFQRFGPINSAMGWRRLNVMVTRARKRMEVFSSLLPSDIHGGPDKSRGVNAYRDFLEYAMNGMIREIGSESGREPGSPFEESVARVVESAGLEAVFQVGVAGYYIDIGVRRREGDRSYLLGIECDGATYHSSKSARDRDRLREEIIKGRGWNLHRIWSTDWFLNQKAEEERLIRRLQECIK
jgi:DNA polymerase III delta prime subunit